MFSDTLKEHNAAVANWRKVEKAMRAKKEAAARRRAGRLAGMPAGGRRRGSTLRQGCGPAPRLAPRPALLPMPRRPSRSPLPMRKPKKQ